MKNLFISIVFLLQILNFGQVTNQFLEHDGNDEINTIEIVEEFAQYTSTNSTNLYYSNPMKSYFANLKGNIGQNFKGSCGYVALAMLLSYYDTFINDNIIPETFDITSIGSYSTSAIYRNESPGVLKESISTSYRNASNDVYYNLLESYKNVSLHSKLVFIGKDYFNYGLGTGYNSRKNILQKYIALNTNLSSNLMINGINYESNESKSNEVRSFVISKLNSGIPVIVGAKSTITNSYHAMIAYDYDSANDKIYCNYGWGYQNYHTYFEDNFDIYRSALSISFSNSVVHSNNYQFNSAISSFKFYECGCGYSTHPTHSHNHSYTSAGSLKHKAYCICGSYVTQNHNFTLSDTCLCGQKREIILVKKEELEHE